jgi:hypothetical protein
MFAAQFAASIIEVLTSNNTDSEIDVFYEGIVEAISSADIIQIGSAFFFNPVESSSLIDTPTTSFNYPFSLVEATTLAESFNTSAQFSQIIVEVLYSLDNQSVSGWVRINDNQTPTWGVQTITITGYGIFGDFLFAMAPISGSLTNVIYPQQSSVTWTPVNNTENPGWNTVNNTQ